MKKLISVILALALAASLPVLAFAEEKPSVDGEWCIIPCIYYTECSLKTDKNGDYQIGVKDEEVAADLDDYLSGMEAEENLFTVDFEDGFLSYSYYEDAFTGHTIDGLAVLPDSKGGYLLYSVNGKPKKALFSDGKIVPEKPDDSDAKEYSISGNNLYFVYDDHYEKGSLLFIGDDAFLRETEVTYKEFTYLDSMLFVRVDLIK